MRDLKHAARTLLKSPTFTAVAVISLALGIGANTAIFQLLDAVRLRTLPVKAPQELVEVHIPDMGAARGNWMRQNSVTNPLWEQIRQRQQVFSQIFAWADEGFNISSDRETRYANGLWVSGNLFEGLGVEPVLGRMFNSADDQHGCGLAGTVISYGFWQREFGGSASALGRKIKLDGGSVEVIGVTDGRVRCWPWTRGFPWPGWCGLLLPISEVLNGVRKSAGMEDILLSVVSVIELEHGLWRANTPELADRRRIYLDEVYFAIPVQPFTKEMGQLAARIDAEARRAGIVIPFADLQIGVTALHLGYAIGTLNARHFEMIPGLKVEKLDIQNEQKL